MPSAFETAPASRWRLRRRPDPGAAASTLAVQFRLHRVGQERRLVDRLQPPRRTGERLLEVAVAPHHLYPGLRVGEAAGHTGHVEAGVGPGLELHGQRIAAAERRPGGIGDDGHAALDLHHLANARHLRRRRGVEAAHLPLPVGRAHHGAEEHPRHADIGAEDGLAADLGGSVDACQPRPHDAARLPVLERRVLRDLELGGGGGELAVAEPPLARPVEHGAGLGAAGRGLDAPAPRRRGDEHLACRGAGLAERIPGPPHARRSAGPHAPEGRVAVGLDDAHALPVGLELLGDDHGHGGEDALAHLRLGDPDAHRPLAIDGQPGVGLEGRLLRGRGARGGRQVHAEPQPGACAGGDADEAAAPELHHRGGAHVVLRAARWMARRIRL
jgi:hypothetical protein